MPLLDNLGLPVHASSIGNLITTTTTGSELQCSAQARPVNFVVVVLSEPRQTKYNHVVNFVVVLKFWASCEKMVK